MIPSGIPTESDTLIRTVRLLALGGDGVGPEVMEPTLRLLQRESALCIDEAFAGHDAFRQTGTTIDASTLTQARTVDGVMFGCSATPSPPPADYQSPILLLRRELGLVANIRACRDPSGDVIDVVMVRDCIEGLYSEVERPIDNGYLAEYRITRDVTTRIAAVAADIARNRHGIVTVVHKANVLRHADGLFRSAAIAELDRKGIRHDEALADAAGYHLVLNPRRYDVMMMTSHVGDILSDVGAAIAGGLGLVPSLTLGSGPPLAEPIHGSAPDISGTGLADPVAMMLSAAMLLDSLGRRFFAKHLGDAVRGHLRERTRGKPLRTLSVYDDVARRLDASLEMASTPS